MVPGPGPRWQWGRKLRAPGMQARDRGGVAGCSDTSACELGQWRLERGWYSSASSGFACVWYLGHDFLWGGGRAGVWWHRIKSNFWPGAEAPGGENGALWISGGGIANGTKSLSFCVRKSNFRSGGDPPEPPLRLRTFLFIEKRRFSTKAGIFADFRSFQCF